MARPSTTELATAEPARRRRARAVARRLAGAYPDARCGLDFRDPWQLLVATVLSAQCTDERVNRVTPVLFSRWAGPAELAVAAVAELEDAVRPLGLHRTRARALVALARTVRDHHGSQVPADLAALRALPGVGRKTAAVVLGEGFGIAAAVVVDTHVRRLAHRLALSAATAAERVSVELEGLLARSEWIAFSRRAIAHGRGVCHARRPACDGCPLEELCPRVGV